LGSGRFKLNGSPQPTLTRHHRLGDARYISADFPVAAELSWLPQIDFRHGVIELLATFSEGRR
jgi:hypothetical protein